MHKEDEAFFRDILESARFIPLPEVKPLPRTGGMGTVAGQGSSGRTAPDAEADAAQADKAARISLKRTA